MSFSEGVEPILDPGLPIVDAHHHMWFMPTTALEALDQESIAVREFAPIYRRHQRYLFDEILADFRSGHNIRASIYVEADAMRKSRGPERMRSVGEVEFATGVAAMGESGLFGDIRVCAGIVGGIDLRIGDAVVDVLDAHRQVAGSRYRGVRSRPVAHDDDSSILGGGTQAHVLLDPQFRAGFKLLQPLGLSFDVFLLEPQLPELIDLARAFSDTQIVMNHVGGPVGVGRYAGKRQERFVIWRKNIEALSQCANVAVKLGGLGLPFAGFNRGAPAQAISSEHLAQQWAPYILTCIEVFGAARCMFESNFPMDAAAGSYAVLWNAFKRLAVGASCEEKIALFGGTARRVYGLDI